MFNFSRTPKVMKGAESIHLEGNDNAVLLIHGFTGSPFELKELAHCLNESGYSVDVPRLPGHGTVIEDMLTTRYQDWLRKVVDAYIDLKSKYKKVFVGGLSMGGTLTLALAEIFGDIDGIFPLAAPIKLNRMDLKLTWLMKYFVKTRPKDPKGNVETVSYDADPIPQAWEMNKLMAMVRKNLRRVTAPCLVVYSKKDGTVPYSNAELVYHGISSEKRKLVSLEESGHIITMDVEKEKVSSSVVEFIRKIEK